MNNEPISKKSVNNKVVLIAIIATIIVGYFIANAITNSSDPQTVTPPINTQINPSIYKANEASLKVVIDEVKDIRILDVRYALDRVTNLQTSQYPFFAMKDQNSDGYIGILQTPKGKAVFLVPYVALNQSNYDDLVRSIKAINGTAKMFDNNFQFASGYDALKLINLAENK